MSNEQKSENKKQDNIIITFENGETKEYKNVEPVKRPDPTNSKEVEEEELTNDTKLSKYIGDGFHYRFTSTSMEEAGDPAKQMKTKTISKQTNVYAKDKIAGIELIELTTRTISNKE